jgi:hypothetical protein
MWCARVSVHIKLTPDRLYSLLHAGDAETNFEPG